MSIHSPISKMYQNRGDDEELAVKCRIMRCSDLVAAEDRYHRKCRDTFNLDSKSAKSIFNLDKVLNNFKILKSYVNG